MFFSLARKVDRIEHAIGSIVSRIDTLQSKLEAVATAKTKRRETMIQLLDNITEQTYHFQRDKVQQDGMEERFPSEAYFRPSSAQSRISEESSLTLKVRFRLVCVVLMYLKYQSIMQ